MNDLISCLLVTKRLSNKKTKRSIYSYKNQTYNNKELIIVYSHASEKDAEDIVTLLDTNNVPNYVLYNIDDKTTLGEARNISIDIAQGDWVCQWDDDDISHPDRLTFQHTWNIENNADSSIFSAQYHIFENKDPVEIYLENRKQIGATEHSGWAGTIMARRNLMHNIYPKLRIEEDTPALSKLKNLKVIVYTDEKFHYMYSYHGNNTWNLTHNELMVRENSINKFDEKNIELNSWILEFNYYHVNFNEFKQAKNKITCDYYNTYKNFIGDAVYVNILKYIKCFYPYFNNEDKKEMIFRYFYCAEKCNILRGCCDKTTQFLSGICYTNLKESFSDVIFNFNKEKEIEGVIITGKDFGLVELCRYFYEKHNKNINIEKIFLFKNTVDINYDIPIFYINDKDIRHDGLLRSNSLNVYDESHYKDLSNMDYDHKTYMVIDSDLFFIDKIDFSIFNKNENSPRSWILKIDNNTKYWLGNNITRSALNWMDDKKYIHTSRGLSILSEIEKLQKYKIIKYDHIKELHDNDFKYMHEPFKRLRQALVANGVNKNNISEIIHKDEKFLRNIQYFMGLYE